MPASEVLNNLLVLVYWVLVVTLKSFISTLINVFFLPDQTVLKDGISVKWRYSIVGRYHGQALRSGKFTM
jgi:uncharacterized membrane-anchored protein